MASRIGLITISSRSLRDMKIPVGTPITSEITTAAVTRARVFMAISQ